MRREAAIAWSAFRALTTSTTCGAALKAAPPAWSNRAEHVPVPLVIVNVDPELEQAPELEKTTAPPGAVAATEKLEPKTADAGACGRDRDRLGSPSASPRSTSRLRSSVAVAPTLKCRWSVREPRHWPLLSRGHPDIRPCARSAVAPCSP